MNIKGHLKALLDFYLFSDREDEKELDKYIEENRIDYDGVSQEVIELIRQKKAAFQIQKGKKFRENFLKQLGVKNSLGKHIDIGVMETKLLTAYRADNHKTDKVSEIDAAKLDMIRKAKEESRD